MAFAVRLLAQARAPAAACLLRDPRSACLRSRRRWPGPRLGRPPPRRRDRQHRAAAGRASARPERAASGRASGL